MTHTTRNREKLLVRVCRSRGQVDAIERALDAERECGEVLHLIAATRGATTGLMTGVVEDHAREHPVDATEFPGALNNAAVEQPLEVVRTYLK